MIHRTTARAWLAVLGGMSLCGCATAAPPPAVQTTAGMSTTTILAASHLPPSLVLKRVTVEVDGVHQRSVVGPEVTAQADRPFVLAVTPLKHGWHQVLIRTTATAPQGQETFALHTTQGFRVEGTQSTLQVDIEGTGQSGGTGPIQAKFRMRGGELQAVEPSGGAAGADANGGCARRKVPDDTVCATEDLYQRAVADADAVRAVCVADKLSKMRRLVQRLRLQAASDAADQPYVGAMMGAAAAQIQTLGRQARECPFSHGS